MASTPSTRERRPTRELTDELLPYQGDWTVEEYLKLSARRIIEFTDGFLEFAPMPTDLHQELVDYINSAVKAILAKRGNGVVRFSPFKVRISEKKFREPDVTVLLDSSDPRRTQEYWAGADFVVEVVSPDDPRRDYEEKREAYAEAGIPEYWIIDPQTRTFTLLRLVDGTYVERSVLREQGIATSDVVAGLAIDVQDCFSAIDRAAPSSKSRKTE
jgi:Uma2 family endonuclease